MKAPDKIYIPLYPNYSLDGFHLADEWMYEPHKECDNAEFIRKDALLEWAKEHQEGERQGSYTWSCYQIFIDKLNEM